MKRARCVVAHEENNLLLTRLLNSLRTDESTSYGVPLCEDSELYMAGNYNNDQNHTE